MKLQPEEECHESKLLWLVKEEIQPLRGSAKFGNLS